MQRSLFIGIGAGLAAAALYSTVISSSLMAVLLIYIAPLPLFIAGLGWGSVTAAIGTVSGVAVITVISGFRVGLLFFLTVGVAPVLLSHLATLSRNTPDITGREGAPVASGREYYPEGRLILWTALLAGLLVTITIVVLGPDAQSFQAVLRDTVTRAISEQPLLQDQIKASNPAEVSRLVDLFVWMMPPVSALLWLLLSLANLYVAARVVTISGVTLRPWAPFSHLAVPRSVALAPLAVAMAALAPGVVGLIGSVFLAVILGSFAILGLAAIHARTLGMAGRPVLLGAFYAALIVFNWIFLLALAVIGMIRTLAGQDHPVGRPPVPR